MKFLRIRYALRWAATLGLLLGASAALGQDCDCSCEAFDELRSTMEDYQEQARSGERTMPPPEIQQMAACAGQCAMEWGQCTQTHSSARTRAEHDERDESPTTKPSTEGDPSSAPADYALGVARDDLERFYGVYGSADQPNRDFFVAAARNNRGEGRDIPDGYLMVGAMWGDVAPWFMKAVGERRFEQQWVNPAATALIVEFDVDDDGQATALHFLSGFAAERGRLERESDLPDGW